ncbi:HlyD family secretion protein [Bradyrhizobium sp. LM2.7]
MRKLVLVFLSSLILGVAIAAAPEQSPVVAYQFAKASSGEAVTKVIAAGTVQPIVSVVVSSQVSGQVKEILVDHNDAVKEGQPIALLEPELFNTRVDQARAEVDIASDAVRIAQEEVTTAQAVVNRATADRAKAEADSKRYEVTVGLTRQHLDRKSVLVKSGAVSTSDMEDASVAYETALADSGAAAAQVASQEVRIHEAKTQLAVARSRVVHSEAQVRRSQAALHQAEADLDRTVIRAPMNGIVIDRSVTAGQTVAASFQAPTLFTIGDLHAVNIEIAVDEADIGELRAGQKVMFSVDAYSDKDFVGHVTQIRKSPHIQESVVTYTVVAAAKNDDLLLFRGMTAKADIIVGDKPDALQVPSAALRFRPKGLPQPSGSHVWVAAGSSIRPVSVRVGVSTEGRTEIIGDVSEGEAVAVGDGANVASPAVWANGMGWIEPLHVALAALVNR